jgi:hypothetical protein
VVLCDKVTLQDAHMFEQLVEEKERKVEVFLGFKGEGAYLVVAERQECILTI